MTFKCEKCGTLCGIDLATEKPDQEDVRFENIDGYFVYFNDAHVICPICSKEMIALIEDEDQNDKEGQ